MQTPTQNARTHNACYIHLLWNALQWCRWPVSKSAPPTTSVLCPVHRGIRLQQNNYFLLHDITVTMATHWMSVHKSICWNRQSNRLNVHPVGMASWDCHEASEMYEKEVCLSHACWFTRWSSHSLFSRRMLKIRPAIIFIPLFVSVVLLPPPTNSHSPLFLSKWLKLLRLFFLGSLFSNLLSYD